MTYKLWEVDTPTSKLYDRETPSYLPYTAPINLFRLAYGRMLSGPKKRDPSPKDEIDSLRKVYFRQIRADRKAWLKEKKRNG